LKAAAFDTLIESDLVDKKEIILTLKSLGFDEEDLYNLEIDNDLVDEVFQPLPPKRTFFMSLGKIEHGLMCPKCGMKLEENQEKCSRCYQVIDWSKKR